MALDRGDVGILHRVARHPGDPFARVARRFPNAPMVFNEPGQPDLQMNLNQRVQRLNENVYEVVLGITLTWKARPGGG